jgi:hypothetical protein
MATEHHDYSRRKRSTLFRVSIDSRGQQRKSKSRKHDLNAPLSCKEKGKSWQELAETALP